MIDFRGNAKLTDFGLSKRKSNIQDLNYSFCGSLNYMAPEVLTRIGHNHMCDIYTLGVLTYELLAGFAPWGGNTINDVYKNILKDELSFPKHFSSSAKNFIRSCMMRDRKKRLGYTNGIPDLLEHPFMKTSYKRVMAHQGKTVGPLANKLTQVKAARDKRLSVFMGTDNFGKDGQIYSCINKTDFGH